MSLLSTQYWVARAAMGADDDAENAPDGGGEIAKRSRKYL